MARSFNQFIPFFFWFPQTLKVFTTERVFCLAGLTFFFLDARKLAKSPQLLLTCAPSFLSFRGRQEVRALCLFGCGGKS